ncbi:MAG: hypothetical protein Q9225_005526 [Loekoesia sp. 1 TL-2023]
MQGSNARDEAPSPVNILLTSHQNSDEAVETGVGSFQLVNANDQPIVPEYELRRIAKSVKNVLPNVDVPSTKVISKQLEATLRAVIRTAGSGQLSESHAAAACDALRGCLAHCENSANVEIRALAYSPKTWVDVFNVFLGTFESRRSKPLKLLLTALERNLVKNPSQSIKDDLVAYISLRNWQTISAHNDNYAIKPALQALRHFLSKSVIQARDIILAVSQSQIDCLSLIVLNPVMYFFAKFCLGCATQTQLQSPGVLHGDQPIWLSASKSFLQLYPDLLDLLAAHVLPEIVRQDREGIEEYVQKLHHLTGSGFTSSHPMELEINLLLTRLLTETGSYNAIDNQTVEDIGARLLCHTNPRIRSAAISLVVNSSPAKELLAEKTLRSLRVALPFYHMEVNPRLRQDNVDIIKRLISRLVASLNARNRRTRANFPRASLAGREDPDPTIQVKSENEEHKHRLHLSFLAWYFSFLTRELSPTATYQRHIVCLKLVDFLLSNLLNVEQPWTRHNIHGRKRKSEQFQFNREFLISLLDLVMDPFADVRDLAASILRDRSKALWPNVTLETLCSMSNLSTIIEEQGTGGNRPTSIHRPIALGVLQRVRLRMQRSGRADHADGFGRFYDLIYGPHGISDKGTAWGEEPRLVFDNLTSELEQFVSMVRDNLHHAVKSASLHGYLIAARYLVDRNNNQSSTDASDKAQVLVWREVIHRLLEISFQIWNAVKVILCADAPEGYEIYKDDKGVGIDTKELLSYCWRMLKESSTLMHSMISSAKPAPIAQMFQHVHYREVGELAFQQLAELRHRGAFSTVSQTFAECCLRCAQSNDLMIQALPKEWYQKTLLRIQQHASALTRRSAGLPAMVTSILAAYPGGPFFDSVIQDLQAIADTAPDTVGSDENLELPQVHALNCLKDIFTETKFGRSVEQHMSVSLEIAVRSLESGQWAIRNCGLMLLKALVTRLNDGTNTYSSRVSSSHRRLSAFVYDKYQNLPDLILRLLTSRVADESGNHLLQAEVQEINVLRAQRVFPALEIIEQSGIPRQNSPEIWNATWTHLEGPVWPLREKAAKALSFLPASEDIKDEIEQCIRRPWPSQNALHGRHLYLRFLFARTGSNTDGSSLMQRYVIHANASRAEHVQHTLTQVLGRFQDMITLNCCPITRSSYTALVADILAAMTSQGTSCQRSGIGNTRGRDPSFFLNISNKVHSAVNGPEFVSYVRQPCPAGPAFALENEAKARCRSINDDLDEELGKHLPLKPGADPSIFMSYGFHGVPRDPEHSDYMLRRTGWFLADWSTTANQKLAISKERMECWARALKLAQNKNADVSTRQAAIDSLADYLHIKQYGPIESNTTPEMLDFFLVLHDSLLDDDEDVRSTGAAATSEFLIFIASKDDDADVAIPLMVPAARHQLLDFLKTQYHSSPNLWVKAVQRLVGADPSPALHEFPSPKALLQELVREDTALFVEEKQNLYIDEAREASVWQEVMLSMDRSTVNCDILQRLKEWATQGLYALIEVTEKEEDGPLGWTSKADVFTLGMKILLAAQVVLRLSEDETLDIDKNGLVVRLEQLLKVGVKKSLRPAWLQIIRETLEDPNLRWFKEFVMKDISFE